MLGQRSLKKLQGDSEVSDEQATYPCFYLFISSAKLSNLHFHEFPVKKMESKWK